MVICNLKVLSNCSWWLLLREGFNLKTLVLRLLVPYLARRPGQKWIIASLSNHQECEIKEDIIIIIYIFAIQHFCTQIKYGSMCASQETFRGTGNGREKTVRSRFSRSFSNPKHQLIQYSIKMYSISSSYYLPFLS